MCNHLLRSEFFWQSSHKRSVIKIWVYEGNARADLIVGFGRAVNKHFLGKGRLCIEEFVDTGAAPDQPHFIVFDEEREQLLRGTWAEASSPPSGAEHKEAEDVISKIEVWQDFRRDGWKRLQESHVALGRPLRHSFVGGDSVLVQTQRAFYRLLRGSGWAGGDAWQAACEKVASA